MASDYVLPNVSAIAILLLMLVNGRQLEVGNAHLPMARTKVPEPDFLNLSGEKNPNREKLQSLLVSQRENALRHKPPFYP